MYNYDFKNEKIKYEQNKCFIEIDDKELYVNILVTENNLLLFYDIENDFIKMKTQGVLVTPNYELLKKIELNNLKYECSENNTNIDNGKIIIYNFNLDDIFK